MKFWYGGVDEWGKGELNEWKKEKMWMMRCCEYDIARGNEDRENNKKGRERKKGEVPDVGAWWWERGKERRCVWECDYEIEWLRKYRMVEKERMWLSVKVRRWLCGFENDRDEKKWKKMKVEDLVKVLVWSWFLTRDFLSLSLSIYLLSIFSPLFYYLSFFISLSLFSFFFWGFFLVYFFFS